MARFCEIVRPAHVIIENVPGVERDSLRVAQRTWSRLSELGYQVDSGIIDASRIGVAQKRRRSVSIASLEVSPSVAEAESDASVPVRDVMWAISDLAHFSTDRSFDCSPRLSSDTAERIDFLFDNELHDLPDSERPDCHRLKQHSYVSVYGRMHADRPAQTVTTGVGIMGRGRYVHPTERRTITPHEAARIQFFPRLLRLRSGRKNAPAEDNRQCSAPEDGLCVGPSPPAMTKRSAPRAVGRSLRVAGLFAGIGGIELGLESAGHQTNLLCELDPHAAHVLRTRLSCPDHHDDVTTLKGLPKVDLVAAGFPCQDLSLAGTRAGLSGARSGLVGEIFRLIRRSKPEFLLFENVSHLLRLDRGAAIRSLLDTLEENRYRWAYRLVDTRGFGLPQRRASGHHSRLARRR